MTCPCRTESPSLTFTTCSRPLARGTTSTVAAPIRLPTTRICSAIGARLTVANSTGIGGLRRAAPAAGGRTAARRVAAAVVDQHAGQADDGHDYDRDCSAHW